MAQSTAASASENPKARSALLFWGCFVALTATSFPFVVRSFIVNSWQIEFGLSETQKGEILGVGFWPFALSIVLFSLIVDKIGYGKAMIFAFVCHVSSVVLLILAGGVGGLTVDPQTGYQLLYLGTFICALAAGTVEAVINPVVATMYPKSKTKMLTILHAGWPGGIVLGGILTLAMEQAAWQVKVAVVLIPTVLYGLMLLRCRFPVHERVKAGVPYRDMLKEAGALGCLIVLYMVIMEVNRLLGLGNLVDTAFFDLPSWPMTLVLAVVSLAYFVYTRSLGRWMYVFLLLVMILLAITELGTDAWMKELRDPAMRKLGLSGGWILVYTAGIMTILRFCIGPIVKVLRPLGVLFISSLLAAAGLYFLSDAAGAWFILLTATVYGAGQCFFWPATLGVVSERFPKGGALTINAIAGVGMLGVGILGNPLLGFWQDTRIDRNLQAKPALYGTFMDPKEKESVFGGYKSLDVAKVNETKDKVALYEYRQEKIEQIKKETSRAPGAADLAAQLAADRAYQTLVRRAVDHLKPTEPKEPGKGATPAQKATHQAEEAAYDAAMKAYKQVDTYEAELAFLAAKGMFIAPEQYERLKGQKDVLDEVSVDAKQNAMAMVAILPLIMAVCYLGLILYFRAKGGYKAIELTAGGQVAGEHKVKPEEAVADEEATPSE